MTDYKIETWKNIGNVAVIRGSDGRFKKVISEKYKPEKYKEIQEKNDEYEYIINVDYKTPTTKLNKTKLYKGHGKHDFQTEFKIISPRPLTDTEIFNKISNTKHYKFYAEVLDKLIDGGHFNIAESQTKQTSLVNFMITHTKVKRD